MANNKIDSRQISHRDLLRQIADANTHNAGSPVAKSDLKGLITALNDEVTPPLRLRASDTPDLILSIDNIDISNSATNRNKTINPIKGLIPGFTSGTITFPSVNGGSITVSPGTNSTLNLAIGEYIKCIITINDSGNLELHFGTADAVEANATLPAILGGIGYVTLFNDAGTIRNIEDSHIFQFQSYEPGFQFQLNGVDQIKRPTLNFTGTNVQVTDIGDRLNITFGDTNGTIVDDNGDIIAKLTPRTVEWVLESPDSNKWEVFVDIDGILYAEDGSTKPITDYAITKENGNLVSFEIDNNGILSVVSPNNPGSILLEHGLFLADTTGLAWQVEIDSTIDIITLESPDGEKWDLIVDNTGTFQTVSGSTKDVDIVKVERDDSTEVHLKVDNTGTLQVDTTVPPTAILFDKIILQAPDNTLFELKIGNDLAIRSDSTSTSGIIIKDTIVTSTAHTLQNKLSIRNDRDEVLFEVREFEGDSGSLKSITYHQILTAADLVFVTPPPAVSGAAPSAMYDTGTEVKPIYFDTINSAWKYMDGTLV